MATYKITAGSVKAIGEAKVGLQVTLVDEAGGKPPLTHYHEVESQNPAAIAAELSRLALEYEGLAMKAAPVVAVETGKVVKATPMPMAVDVPSGLLKG